MRRVTRYVEFYYFFGYAHPKRTGGYVTLRK